MRLVVGWLVVLAACYSPSPREGAQCARNGDCPSELRCDPITNTCLDPGSAADAACPSGFSFDGTSCVDIDECTTATDDCSSDAACTNADGSFACACNAGSTGDGRTCGRVCSSVLIFDDCTAPDSDCITIAEPLFADNAARDLRADRRRRPDLARSVVGVLTRERATHGIDACLIGLDDPHPCRTSAAARAISSADTSILQTRSSQPKVPCTIGDPQRRCELHGAISSVDQDGGRWITRASGSVATVSRANASTTFLRVMKTSRMIGYAHPKMPPHTPPNMPAPEPGRPDIGAST